MVARVSTYMVICVLCLLCWVCCVYCSACRFVCWVFCVVGLFWCVFLCGGLLWLAFPFPHGWGVPSLCVLVSCVSDRVGVCSSCMGGCGCLCVNV